MPIIARSLLALTFLLTAASASAEYRMSAKQIEATVSGNSVSMYTRALKKAEGYFAPDGEVRGSLEGERFSGRWWIENDELCMNVPLFDHEVCRTVIVRGDHLFFFTTTGEPAGRAEVVRGNPDGF